MIKAILKRVIPNFILHQRGKYLAHRRMCRRNKLRQDIISYLDTLPQENRANEKQEILDYLKRHPLCIFPYSYTEKYKAENVVVYMDNEKGMCYVLYDGKRLYFKKGWNEEQVQTYYNSLLIEQDAASPHRYESADFRVREGDVVVDAGVAEGIFALSVVERAKELYLFEADKDWIAPLEATFAPFGNKANIVNCYVTDIWGGGGGMVKSLWINFLNRKI